MKNVQSNLRRLPSNVQSNIWLLPSNVQSTLKHYNNSHSTDLQQSSAIAQHAHASGHEIDFSSAVILAKLQHQQQLDLIEHAAITILEP